ncbi:hypothetical protein M8J77_014972 [Diaphorina citri]|nr:hypothetical protein M8J77_014972 [Diaphorina citri]
MIDGITSVIQNSHFLLYADDLKIYRPISSLSDSALLQDDLNRVQQWLSLNKLAFCPQKCELVRYCRRRSVIPSSYTIDNVTLAIVEVKKDLGVTFVNTLKFKTHIDNIVNTSFRTLAFVMRTLRPISDPDPYLLLFKSLILSKLHYASVVWMPNTQKRKQLLESVQASFCRRLFFKLNGFYPAYPEPISYADLREQLCLLSVESQHEVISLLTLHRVLNNRIDSPDLVSSIHFRVPSNRTRCLNPLGLFSIPSHQYVGISPLYKMLLTHDKYHNEIDISSPINTFRNQWRSVV